MENSYIIIFPHLNCIYYKSKSEELHFPTREVVEKWRREAISLYKRKFPSEKTGRVSIERKKNGKVSIEQPEKTGNWTELSNQFWIYIREKISGISSQKKNVLIVYWKLIKIFHLKRRENELNLAYNWSKFIFIV